MGEDDFEMDEEFLDELEKLTLQSLVENVISEKTLRRKIDLRGSIYTITERLTQNGPVVLITEASHPTKASTPCNACSRSGICPRCNGIGYR